MRESIKERGGQRWLGLLTLLFAFLTACGSGDTADKTAKGSSGSSTASGSRELFNGQPSRRETRAPGTPRTTIGKLGSDLRVGTTQTDATNYPAGSPVIVTYAGFSGGGSDWISIAIPASGDTEYVAYQFVTGTSGTATFNNLPGGTYEARGYFNNTYTRENTSNQFTIVNGASVTTDASSYTQAQSAVVTHAGLQGTPTDWISIALQGSPVTSYVAYQYTAGTPGGTRTFPLTGLADGTYVARAYNANSYTVAAESAPFNIGAPPSPLTTDQTNYTAGQPVVVSYSGLGGSTYDWIAIATDGSPPGTYVTYLYTNGQPNGSVTFNNLASGTYVARSYNNNSFVQEAQSAPFTVAGGGGSTTLTTDKATYLPSESAVVSYTGASGSQDWISIAVAGSPATEYLAYQFTAGGTSGSRTFPLTGMANGNYEARLFFNNTYTVRATAAFTIGAPASPTITTNLTSYAFGDPVIVNWANWPAGGGNDWISIAPQGSPVGTYTTYVYTGGLASGSATFNNLTPGTWVARMHFNNGFAIEGESAPFTIGGTTTCTTNMTTYASSDSIIVSYTVMSGSTQDWVSLSQPGSPAGSFDYFQFTGGGTSGSRTFTGVAPGNYVARCYYNNENTVRAESPQITVTP